MKRPLAFLLFLVCLCTGCASGLAGVDYGQAAAREAGWLWSQQLSNGAFAYCFDGDGTVYVNPYFSVEAAVALLRHDASETSLARIRLYLDWQFSHLNSATEDVNGLDGTICDYDVTVENGLVTAERSRGAYDSTDAYAAMFLIALDEYAKAGGDPVYLAAHRADVGRIVSAVYTTCRDGYTCARPDDTEFYLMDNCEVYAGLKSAAHLYRTILKDDDMADRLEQSVAFYEANFEKDWLRDGRYLPTLDAEAFSWDTFYQDAAAQAFLVVYGLANPGSALSRRIYAEFCSRWHWPEMGYIKSGDTEYYWGHFLLWGVLMGDFDGAAAYLARYEHLTAGDRAYPLYCGDAAMILMALDLLSASGSPAPSPSPSA